MNLEKLKYFITMNGGYYENIVHDISNGIYLV
jgi:hypothetical protein